MIHGFCSAVDTALLQVMQITAASPPSQHNLSLLRDWLQRPDHENHFLRGIESKTWDVEKGCADFVALAPQPAEQDPFSKALYRIIPGFIHEHLGFRLKKPDQHSNFEDGDSSLNRFARSMTTILSALLPTLSIFVLYYVRNVPARLGLILAFTTLFAMTLQLLSRARPAEVFAATAG